MRLRHCEGTFWWISPKPPPPRTLEWLRAIDNNHNKHYANSYLANRFTNVFPTLVNPRPARNRPRGLARRKTPAAAGRGAGRVHVVGGVDQDPGEHAEGDVRGRRQHVRVSDTESVEGHEAEPQSVGGVWGRAPGREKILVFVLREDW